MLLAEPIIRLLFQHGRFLPEDTPKVAYALMALAPGLIAFSMVNILARAFYALGDTRTPMKISIACLMLNLVFALVLVWRFRQAGLGAANTMSAFVNVYLLFRALKGKLGELEFDSLKRVLFRTLAALTLAGAGGVGHQLRVGNGIRARRGRAAIDRGVFADDRGNRNLRGVDLVVESPGGDGDRQAVARTIGPQGEVLSHLEQQGNEGTKFNREILEIRERISLNPFSRISSISAITISVFVFVASVFSYRRNHKGKWLWTMEGARNRVKFMGKLGAHCMRLNDTLDNMRHVNLQETDSPCSRTQHSDEDFDTQA